MLIQRPLDIFAIFSVFHVNLLFPCYSTKIHTLLTALSHAIDLTGNAPSIQSQTCGYLSHNVEGLTEFILY